MEMDFERGEDPGFRSTGPEGRSKSPLRMTYEAEIKVFRSKYGGIEDVRQNLGFSRRKMCQLLLIDPSAWTRWMKDENRVPPHVYRSLEWYLALEKRLKNEPELATLLLRGRPQSDVALSELRLGFESQALTIQRLRWAVLALAMALFGLISFLVLR